MRSILSAIMWAGLLSAVVLLFQGRYMYAIGCLATGFVAGTIGGLVYKNRP